VSGAKLAERLADMAGDETWHRVLNVVERLQVKAPVEGKSTRCLELL
jgi:hypothetical protein